MKKLVIKDIHEERELNPDSLSRLHGGLAALPSYGTFSFDGTVTEPGSTSASGPRPIEDQIILPKNPFDIVDMI